MNRSGDQSEKRFKIEKCVLYFSEPPKDWLRELSPRIRLELANRRLLMVHGSPRRVNEFLWESTTPEPFLAKSFGDDDADTMLCTHTWIQWQRQLPAGRRIVNVEAIGRPPNGGKTTVWCARLSTYPGQSRVGSELLPVAYEMRQEQLPEEFVETILTGWWRTCLEILPPKEQARGVSEPVFSLECIYLKTVRRNSHDYDR